MLRKSRVLETPRFSRITASVLREGSKEFRRGALSLALRKQSNSCHGPIAERWVGDAMLLLNCGTRVGRNSGHASFNVTRRLRRHNPYL
jgi:hypothetical protein